MTGVATGGMGLRIRGIFKAFGRSWALRGVDCDLAPGETVVLFGPNGSGKTTLLKILGTVLRPTRGSGTILGLDLVRECDTIRRRVEFMAHGSYLYEDLTPRENLAFSAVVRGGPGSEGGVAAALDRVGLTAVADERVRTLSSGMRRRVMLARLLARQTDFWLLDEPYTNLDQEAVKVLEAALNEHQARGGMAVMATHNVVEGFRLATRVAILSSGRLVMDEPRAGMTLQGFQDLYAVQAGGGGT